MNEIEYSCPSCGKIFSQQELLDRHNRRQHPKLWCVIYGQINSENKKIPHNHTNENLNGGDENSAMVAEPENEQPAVNDTDAPCSLEAGTDQVAESQVPFLPAIVINETEVIVPISEAQEVERRSSDCTEKIDGPNDMAQETENDVHDERTREADKIEEPPVCLDASENFAHCDSMPKAEEKEKDSGKVLYKCRFCTKTFRQKHSKICHENSRHTRSTPYGCGFCAKSFPTYYSKYCHQAKAHGGKRFGKIKKNGQNKMIVPALNNAGKKEEEKSACHDLEKMVEILEARRILSKNCIIRQNFGDKQVYICGVVGGCCKILATFPQAAAHVFNHLDSIEEGREAVTNGNKNRAAKNDDTISPHPFDLIPKSETVQENLSTKMTDQNDHEPSSTIRASLCETRRDDSGKFIFVCKICGKEFKFFSQLKNHTVVHIKRKNVDNNDPSYSSYITSGQQKIENGPPVTIHRCNFCQKCFSYKRNAEDHSRVHTGERPFACQNCPKKFTSARNLRTHQKMSEEAGTCDRKKSSRKHQRRVKF